MLQKKHAMLIETTHDEKSYQVFSSALKSHLSTNISPKTKNDFTLRVAPRFEVKNRRKIRDRHDVRRVISKNPIYQMSSSLKRTAQEIMFDGVGACAERQLPTVINESKRWKSRGGSLHTNPELKIPKYHTAVDIHCMPGAYHTELCKDDVYAGALYDRTIFLFSMGLRGELNDDFGQSLSAWVRKTYPQFQPENILDIGCSVGHGTLPWADAYPKAKVHAIDVAAPMVRYAQARAAALNKEINFSQQNAEKTNYPDESFDLIVSQIIIHETSNKALRQILAECYRLLKPGGLMVHLDGRSWENLTPYDAFVSDWDTYYNNEPFIGPMHDLDLPKLANDAGFHRNSIFMETTSSVHHESTGSSRQEVISGDFGYVGYFMVYGARK